MSKVYKKIAIVFSLVAILFFIFAPIYPVSVPSTLKECEGKSGFYQPIQCTGTVVGKNLFTYLKAKFFSHKVNPCAGKPDCINIQV